MQPVTRRALILVGILLVLSPIALISQTAIIHVRVLDGRTGRTLSGRHLTFINHHAERDGSETVTASPEGDLYIAHADAQGVLSFGTFDDDGEWLVCSNQQHYDSDTGTYGQDFLYTVPLITSSGFVTHNSCGKNTAAAKPGELLIFLRHSSAWERFRFWTGW